MTKRAIYFVLTALMVLTSAGCGKKTKGSENQENTEIKTETDISSVQHAFDDEEFILDGPPTYDVPYVDPHDGVFVNEHGSMTFNGDGSTVICSFDAEIAEKTGLPEGDYEAEYYFYDPIEPVGYVCQYNEAHEIHFVIGDKTYVVDVGEHTEDDSYMTGVDCTTADRITFFAIGIEGYYDFIKTE